MHASTTMIVAHIILTFGAGLHGTPIDCLLGTPELGGRVDVLINNAGFAFKMADETPFPEQATATLKINYWGTKSVCEAVTPFLRKSYVYHDRARNQM